MHSVEMYISRKTRHTLIIFIFRFEGAGGGSRHPGPALDPPRNFHLHDVMDVFIRALPLCDSLRYVTSEVLIGVLHVRINHSLTHIRSIQWRMTNFSEGGGCSLPQVRYEKCV